MQRNSFRLLLILGALAAIAPLTINMYLPAFPNVVKDLGTDMRNVQLTLAAFLAGLAIGQPLYGSISDLYGRKPPLYAGLLLFVLGSLGLAAPVAGDAYVYRIYNVYNNEVRGEIIYSVDKVDEDRVRVGTRYLRQAPHLAADWKRTRVISMFKDEEG